MRDLVERPVTFEYGYIMTCPNCPSFTFLTSEDYHRGDDGAHVPCAHCGADIHFGRAVMTLRDVNDPALDDSRLADFAWYHTSPHANWPTSSTTLPADIIESWTGLMPADSVEQERLRYEDQALHLGTYEAAVESMLRRMCDQDDGGAQFYLYRVALRHDGLVIEPGWRDENSDTAAQISRADLGDADGIRYLNVHESPGSISLAVRPTAIAEVQCIALPAAALAVHVAPAVLKEIARIRAEIDRIEASRPDDLSPLERLRQNATVRSGREFVRRATPQQAGLASQICHLLEDEYLPGVSRPVRAQFTSALHAWQQAQKTPWTMPATSLGSQQWPPR